MVLGRNDKRKRKEGDLVDLMDPLSESPKRTKVHAQRKFAQGAATVFSPAPTLVKEKEKTKPAMITELITHKRPNTEDFLTFLCFRGTSILPPSLNFFNVGSKKEKSDSKTSTAAKSPNKTSSAAPSTSNSKIDSNPSSHPKTTPKISIAAKKKVTTVVKKNLTKFQTAASTVQALKKKYQEQRLAKQRVKNKFKASCVMRTRSTSERVILKSTSKISPRKFSTRCTETKRRGLRSGSDHADRTKKCASSQTTKTKPIVRKIMRKRSSTKEQTSESSESESETSDDEASTSKTIATTTAAATQQQQQQQQTKRVTNKAMEKKVCTRSKSEMRRITRSQRETPSKSSNPLSRRPSRKTKEAAAVYMEILGRKLTSPDPENDENPSLDSFPELPNARRTAQAENDIKARSKRQFEKPKQTKRHNDKYIETKKNSSKTTRNKTKIEKPEPKSKRTLRVRRYCELDSEDESETSVEYVEQRTTSLANNKQTEKSITRNLRSSLRNQTTIVDAKEIVLPTIKEKFVVKRAKKQRKKLESDESEEETLGNLLDKMRKNNVVKKSDETTTKSDNRSTIDRPKIDTITVPRTNNDQTPSQVSDDEESFRGFTKKSITKVLNSCNSHANANLLASEEAYGKLNVLKTQDTTKMENSASRDPQSLTIDKQQTIEQPIVKSSNLTPTKNNNRENTTTTTTTTTTTISTNEIESQSLDDAIKLEKKCSTINDVGPINLIDMSLDVNQGRKVRVNMSTEQIEKWLTESSMARAKDRKKSSNDSTTTKFSFSTNCDRTKETTTTTHLSIPTRIQHLVRPVNVTIPKVVEKTHNRERIVTNVKSTTSYTTGSRIQTIPKPSKISIPNRNKINADIKEIIKGRGLKQTIGEIVKETTMFEEIDCASKSDQNSVDDTTEKKSTPEKKSIVHGKKQFLPKMRERKIHVPNANAFSPENESSVYAFESDTEVPINTPFRRKIKEFQRNEVATTTTNTEIDGNSHIDNEGSPKSIESTNPCENYEKKLIVKHSTTTTTTNDDNPINSSSNKFSMTKNFENLSNLQILPFGKLSNDWSGINCSASIAVQVNFNEKTVDRENSTDVAEESSGQTKSTEISTQTENVNDNDDENDGGHVFYIPLQTVARNGPNLIQGQQLIQGVAVKLGTEGPNGPNQRVLLRAQLVTKPPIAVARCPPVGTVQPTTRTPPSSNTDATSVFDNSHADSSIASTSNVDNSPSVTTNVVTDFTIANSQSGKNFAATNSGGRCGFGSGYVNEKSTKSPKAQRERKASTDLTKIGKRGSAKSKQKTPEILTPSNTTTFPGSANTNADARLVEAPTFHPTEKDFQDPLEYIDKIRPIAEKFGICRVVPPANFKPECKVSDDMRFTAYNQYVHRMLHRWGPNVKEMMAIKKYLATQSITLTHPPWIGGMEVDLPHLYQTVQIHGGLKEVIEKKKWQKVADGMKIPKSAQDRVTKLDDIYCKYLLPYDTLSPEEREKLFDDVEDNWKKRETKTLQRLGAQLNENDDDDDDDSSDEIEECIVKGRNMPLNAFYRIARNTQRMWFGDNQRSGSETDGASAGEVENAFWKHVAERKRHVCVHAASIDSSGRGFGFSVAKNSPFARHPWNLKVLTNNAGSVLRALGPLMGVTVPTLHVGMLFSACCWYRDPHGLPWIEYLHTGAKKIWYGIPDEHNDNFRDALSKMVPRYCKKKTIWLPSDTAMVPPDTLVSNGVPLCKTVQEPGQFIVVFPKAFTSSICTGYVVSESVYFAQPAWLENAEQVFKDLQDSCEPSIFSFERLLFSIINDSRSHIDVLKQIMPAMLKIREREFEYRKQLEYVGLKNKEKLPLPDTGKGKKSKRVKEEDSDYECETCRANLYVSLVNDTQDDSVYCLPHAFQLIVRKTQVLKNLTLMYTYTEDELDDLIHKLEDRIEAKTKKSNQIRQSK